MQSSRYPNDDQVFASGAHCTVLTYVMSWWATGTQQTTRSVQPKHIRHVHKRRTTEHMCSPGIIFCLPVLFYTLPCCVSSHSRVVQHRWLSLLIGPIEKTAQQHQAYCMLHFLATKHFYKCAGKQVCKANYGLAPGFLAVQLYSASWTQGCMHHLLECLSS